MEKGKSAKGQKSNKKSVKIDLTYDGDCCSNGDSKKKMNWRKNVSCKIDNGGCGGFAYFLGFIGAAVYFISTSTGFWMGVLGFLKAIVWPAFMVYGLLKFLGL